MTDKLLEAARMALEALEMLTDCYDDSAVGLEIDAIKALRAALADHNEEVLEMVEPVAWMYDTIAQDGSVLKDWVSREHPQESALEEERPHNFRRLYTAPQPELTDEHNLDLMVAELEQENRLMRARNERLERELNEALDANSRFKAALESIIAISQLAFWDGKPQGAGQVGAQEHDDKASY
jgi:hypothetical protein